MTKSLAFKIAYGSYVFLVVRTVILPSIKSSVQAIPCVSRNLVMSPQVSRRYCSRYLGKRMAKEDSSVKGAIDSEGRKGSIFHWRRYRDKGEGVSEGRVAEEKGRTLRRA